MAQPHDAHGAKFVVREVMDEENDPPQQKIEHKTDFRRLKTSIRGIEDMLSKFNAIDSGSTSMLSSDLSEHPLPPKQKRKVRLSAEKKKRPEVEPIEKKVRKTLFSDEHTSSRPPSSSKKERIIKERSVMGPE